MSLKTEKQNTVIERVETFIQRVHDLDLVISIKSRDVWLEATEGKQTNLSDRLAKTMRNYEASRGKKVQRYAKALTCLYFIDKAYTCEVISEGNGLISKLRESQEKRAQLKEHNEILSAEVSKLQNKIKKWNAQKRQFKRENK